jgi:hypothetical protein
VNVLVLKIVAPSRRRCRDFPCIPAEVTTMAR